MAEPWVGSKDLAKHHSMFFFFGRIAMSKLDDGDAAFALQLADIMIDYFGRVDSCEVSWFMARHTT
jgi:hypothetical protein